MSAAKEKPTYPVPEWVVPGAKAYYDVFEGGVVHHRITGPVFVKSITKTRVTLTDGTYVNRRDLTYRQSQWYGGRTLLNAMDIVVQMRVAQQNRVIRSQKTLKAIPRPEMGWTEEAFGEAIAAAKAFIEACKGAAGA